jgi:AcrR family transcriptional regulator
MATARPNPSSDATDPAGDPVVGTIWNRPVRNSRGPKPAHSRDEITAVAVRIADAEGLDAVSMRRVATELGAGTTSLYRYFSKKDELFELMIDAAAGEQALEPVTGDWRADLRAVAVNERVLLKRHSWLLSLPTSRAVFGPNNLARIDHALATVENLGLDIDDMLVMVTTLLALVHGYVMNEIADEEATRRSGLDDDAWMRSVGEYGARIIEGDEYPRVARVMRDAEGPHAANRPDREFALGLDRVLDGFAASLEGSASPVDVSRARRG